MQRLVVSENKRFLALEDKTPFFWLADTAWELFHKCTLEQAEQYLKIRSEQSFNVIQAVVLSEFDGLRVPTPDGYLPLHQDKDGKFLAEKPTEDYFCHVDAIIDLAEKYCIYVALVPTWGDKWNKEWGIGPEIFNSENAYAYGKYLGERYRERNNIVWVMGGDRPVKTDEHLQIVRNMAQGIKTGGAAQLMTFHPMGGQSSSQSVHNEDWLDFNMIQSGHSKVFSETHNMIAHDYALQPTKPVVDGECNYEDHPKTFDPKNGYFDDTDVRYASYYAVFSGSFGITYGHHSVWAMIQTREDVENNPKNDVPYHFLMTVWDALLRPAAEQMRHLKSLMEKYDFSECIPANDRLAVNYEGARHQVATAGKDCLMVYCPCGIPCRIKPIEKEFTAQWFDPRSGEYMPADAVDEEKAVMFAPPTSGRNSDYVLVVTY